MWAQRMRAIEMERHQVIAGLVISARTVAKKMVNDESC
ncbi:hypothetical protein CEB3_c39140 [Peptococcaceae bacterium CEB3]|nr:hypothetical protein CEB3_c39140 [Peptococcaceae bacterium CEB3]